MVTSRVIAVLLLVAGAQCADPALASKLGVNGLERASDLASAPFPADGAFVLSWSWSSKFPAAGCRGFEVQLVDEQTAFPQAAAAVAATTAHAGIVTDGRRLSWSSGPVAGANATSFALPASASGAQKATAPVQVCYINLSFDGLRIANSSNLLIFSHLELCKT